MQLQKIDATVPCPNNQAAKSDPRSLPSALLDAAAEYAFRTDRDLMLFDANGGGARLVWARPRRADGRGPVGQSAFLLRRLGHRSWRRFLALAASAVLGACGGGGGGGGDNTADAYAKGVAVTMMLSESAPLPPAMVDGTCVVFTPVLSAQESSEYLSERTRKMFEHIGQSLRTCMDGKALSYLGTLPASPFFQDTLFINLDGTCPAGASGCYWPGNPTIDRAQTRWPTDPVAADQLVSGLVGHETWHAVAGWYHK